MSAGAALADDLGRRPGAHRLALGTSNGTTTLRFVDPMHHRTRVVHGLTETVVGNTVRITGHAVRLVLTHTHAGFTSSSLKVSGTIVRGRFQVEA